MSVPSVRPSHSWLMLFFVVKGIDAKVVATGFIIWNVKGVKRARIFKHLKHLKCDVAFLRETHLLVKDQVILKKGRVGKVPTLVPKHAGQP